MPWQIQGGFEEHCWNLARALAKLGSNVTIVTSSFDETVETETRDGIRVEYVKHLPRNRDKTPMWRWWGRFPKAARQRVLAAGLTADLLLSEGRGGRRLLTATKVHGGRTVYVSHGTFDQAYRLFARPDLLTRVSRLHPRAIAQALIARRDLRRDRKDMQRARVVVAVSPFVAQSIRSTYGIRADKIETIGNGVTIPPRLPSRTAARAKLGWGKGTWLLFLGRLEPVKGPRDLLQAISSRPDLHLAIAGVGPEETALSAMVEVEHLHDRVRLLGRVSDTEKWDCYAATDLFILPSKSEGEPIAILEALGAGRPVLTTRDWVAPDLGEGCVIDTDLARGIDTALAAKPPMETVAQRVRRDHTWESVARRYLELAKR